jgi:DNA-binding MarR family transcriptional regulator
MGLNRKGDPAPAPSMSWTGLRLSAVANRYTYPLYAEIEQTHGLLRDEVVVIVMVGSGRASTAVEVVAYTGRPKNGISRAVRKLEAEGLLRREAHDRDGRLATLHLERRGERLYGLVVGYFEARDRKMLAELDEGDRRTLKRIINIISDPASDWSSMPPKDSQQ